MKITTFIRLRNEIIKLRKLNDYSGPIEIYDSIIIEQNVYDEQVWNNLKAIILNT